MKKIFLLAALVVMSASAAMAQTSYGLKGGLNMANVSDYGGDMKASFYVGGFAEFRLSHVLAISPELVYSRQGSQSSWTEGDVDIKAKVRLNYLNVPVLAKLYLTDGLSLDLGPQFGYMLNAKSWAKVDGDSSTEDMEDMKSFDVSFAAGLTYNFGKCFVQGRYNIGLTKVEDYDDSDARNGVIQLGLGYRF